MVSGRWQLWPLAGPIRQFSVHRHAVASVRDDRDPDASATEPDLSAVPGPLVRRVLAVAAQVEAQSRGLDLLAMALGPLADGENRLQQGAPKIGEFVIHPRRDGR